MALSHFYNKDRRDERRLKLLQRHPKASSDQFIHMASGMLLLKSAVIGLYGHAAIDSELLSRASESLDEKESYRERTEVPRGGVPNPVGEKR